MVSNVENLNPQLMRILAKEVQNLKQEPLEGIHILLDDKDITSFEAILEGPADTPYFGGRFRVKLSIGKDFPSSPPQGKHLFFAPDFENGYMRLNKIVNQIIQIFSSIQ